MSASAGVASFWASKAVVGSGVTLEGASDIGASPTIAPKASDASAAPG